MERLEHEADAFWNSFVLEVTHHNRFNPKHKIHDFLKEYLKKHECILNGGSILYRARIINYDSKDAENTGIRKWMKHEEYGSFEGYDSQNSYVPPAAIVPAGRANPEQIAYLYAATEEITAIGETRPRIYDHISVAKIQLQKDIKLADLTQTIRASTDQLDEMKIQRVIHAFESPCKDSIEYIPTQYIAEYIKSLGFDGLMFKSSFVPGGTNVTIFDTNVAKPIASAPYKMDSISYRARRIFPLKDVKAFKLTVTNESSSD